MNRSIKCFSLHTRIYHVGVKSGAAKSGTYVKDKTVAGATYMKEKDWSREKEMAGKAGTATKK